MNDTQMSDTINEYGNPGSRGCACVSHDAHTCAAIRYHRTPPDGAVDLADDDPCKCLCHKWDDEETLQ